jgi:hypothetical protein
LPFIVRIRRLVFFTLDYALVGEFRLFCTLLDLRFPGLGPCDSAGAEIIVTTFRGLDGEVGSIGNNIGYISLQISKFNEKYTKLMIFNGISSALLLTTKRRPTPVTVA